MVSFHVDVQLHHVAEGISTIRRIEHHGQGLMPASEPQPIEVVDGLAAFDPCGQQIQAEPRVTQCRINDQASGSACELHQEFGRFIEGAVPPHPGGQIFRKQWLQDGEAIFQRRLAPAQNNDITAGNGSTPLLRQWAVSGNKGFQGLLVIQAWGQGDQSTWPEGAEGCIDVLAPEVISLLGSAHAA